MRQDGACDRAASTRKGEQLSARHKVRTEEAELTWLQIWREVSSGREGGEGMGRGRARTAADLARAKLNMHGACTWHMAHAHGTWHMAHVHTAHAHGTWHMAHVHMAHAHVHMAHTCREVAAHPLGANIERPDDDR